MTRGVSKLVLDNHGSYLGMKKGCFVLRDKHGDIERYPLFENEIGEVVLNQDSTYHPPYVIPRPTFG